MGIIYENGVMIGVEFDDTRGRFFFGKVKLLDQNILYTRYRIEKTGSVIQVPTGFHIRMVLNQMKLPDKFRIMTPMETLQVELGSIPESMIITNTWRHYANQHKIYYGVYPS